MAQSTTRKKQLPRQAASKKPAAKAKTASKQGGRPRSASNGKKPAPSKKAQASRRAAPSTHKHNQRAALVLFAVAVLLLLVALIPGTKGWLMAHHLLHGLFGIWSVLWAVLLLYVAVMSSFFERERLNGKVLLASLSIFALCGASNALATPADSASLADFSGQLQALFLNSKDGGGAGLVGGLIGLPATVAFGKLGACIVLFVVLFVLLMLLTGMTLVRLWRGMQRSASAVGQAVATVHEQHVERQERKNRQRSRNIDIPLDDEGMPLHPVHTPPPVENEKLRRLEEALDIAPESPPKQGAQIPPPAAVVEKKMKRPAQPTQQPVADSGSAQAAEKYMQRLQTEQQAAHTAAPARPQEIPADTLEDGYHKPPVSMLEADVVPDQTAVAGELQTKGQQLVQVLKSFGVTAKIVDISRGPCVTRYELQPAPGVKISKITNLSDDIAMNLAASGVRIEAPIPGKAAVGIEVPNQQKSMVHMRDLIESNAFQGAKSKLTVCLDRDIAGAPKVADLAKMPHLLIAGTTGSGKSVCLNSFIVSLLYKSTPDEVRFLMIDPKVVELSVYNGIPQLLVPVVTDPRKAAGALGWAVTEMLKRYKTFADCNVRDIKSYNAMAAQRGYVTEDGQPMEHMPQIVIFIEELADLMMAAPNEVEDSICRLAQMARAAGMHLVIATQRPSVDVVTGLIKANIPSRIALSVSSQVDSRTIIDSSGAEKLLGNGDMLFSPVGVQKPLRVQGAFVSDSEIESIVEFIKKSQEPGYDPAIAEEIEKNAVADKKHAAASEETDTDPMLDEAVKCVVEAGQASTSLLQRRLRLGYARAGRIVDQMEQLGIVGPHEGSKPRQVLITYQQWLERSMNAHAPAQKEGDPPTLDDV